MKERKDSPMDPRLLRLADALMLMGERAVVLKVAFVGEEGMKYPMAKFSEGDSISSSVSLKKQEPSGCGEGVQDEDRHILVERRRVIWQCWTVPATPCKISDGPLWH